MTALVHNIMTTIETILIYFYSLGFTFNARPHKRQRFNHHRVEIKVSKQKIKAYYTLQKARVKENLLTMNKKIRCNVWELS